jgi:hypothetical protein
MREAESRCKRDLNGVWPDYWRCTLLLSKAPDVAHDLVQPTCVRERAHRSIRAGNTC